MKIFSTLWPSIATMSWMGQRGLNDQANARASQHGEQRCERRDRCDDGVVGCPVATPNRSIETLIGLGVPIAQALGQFEIPMPFNDHNLSLD
jgi:hypothetical protein